MEKEYSSKKHPEIKEDQFGFNRALLAMLNCRRYLQNQGFKTEIEEHGDSGSFVDVRGEIIFPDNSKVDFNGFKHTRDKNSLLERMVSTGVKFERIEWEPLSFERSYIREKAVKTSLGDDEGDHIAGYGSKRKGWTFTLSVVDTTKKKAWFPLSLFLYTPQKFALGYKIKLEKDIITDKDLEDFEKYKKGLGAAIMNESFVNYEVTPVSKPKLEKKIQKGVVEIIPAQVSFPTSLVVGIPEDNELAKIVRSISKVGEDLLYGHVDNEVAYGLINQHKGYIEDYIRSAATLVQKFQIADKYLQILDVGEVKEDIGRLTDKVGNDRSASRRTLGEKQHTLKNIEYIQSNRDKTFDSLMEIDATLLSLQTSIVGMETGDKDEHVARKEMQTSISALCQALDKVFGELKEEDVEIPQKSFITLE